MTNITDTKLVYPEFKLFKDTYTRLKVSEKIYFSCKDSQIIIGLVNGTPFYRLYGKWNATTEFFNWLKSGHSTEISIEDFNLIAKCLKKNAISVEYDDTKFVFNFKDKEDNLQCIELLNTNITESIFTSPFITIESCESNLPSTIFEDDLIRLYQRYENISTEKIGTLLLEIPRTSVLSFQPKADSVTVRYTAHPEIDRKYVEVESTYDGLTLVQLFATI